MINPTYLNEVQRYLFYDEMVEFTTRQRRVGPGGSILSPSVVVATNQRLLVIRDVLELHIHENIDAIPYSNMTYVKYEHGLMSCILAIGVLGFSAHGGSAANSYNVEGLRHGDAMELAQLLDKMIIRFRQRGGQNEEQKAAGIDYDRYKQGLVCKACHAKNPFNARYCSNCGATL